jgi:hypothetical protein
MRGSTRGGIARRRIPKQVWKHHEVGLGSECGHSDVIRSWLVSVCALRPDNRRREQKTASKVPPVMEEVSNPVFNE